MQPLYESQINKKSPCMTTKFTIYIQASLNNTEKPGYNINVQQRRIHEVIITPNCMTLHFATGPIESLCMTQLKRI